MVTVQANQGIPLTSGMLQIGSEYYIKKYNLADDFLNVGATINATGNRFTATGATPTNWTKGSVLVKFTEGLEVRESGGFLNSAFGLPFFGDEWIEFEHEVDFRVIKQIEGRTTRRDGVKIDNFYGLVEFTNELGALEYGYIFSIQPSGNGKWKLLKANR